MFEQLTAYIQNKISIDKEEVDMILSYFKPLKINKNDFLVNQGQTSRRTFFVVKGCLRIFFINEEGQEATRYFAFENLFATALVSFITGNPSEESIQAVEESEILYINHNDFYLLLEKVPQWEKFLRHYLENAYVINTNRLMSFLMQSAAERYRQLLLENPKAVNRLPNKLIASYLNVSQETLSRLKSKI